MNIEEIIKRSRKSLKEIAKEAKIDPKHLYKIRNGTSEPTSSVIIRLCDALGCTADELLGRDKKTPSERTEGAAKKERDDSDSKNDV